ncbi:hypothetical protein SRABI96_05200 [Peribacillus sp. Bi96]|nr:hypothetical protein SRABI96_05200 [Peribacillus sp. Bi96]
MDIESTELTGQRAKLVPIHIDHIEGLFEESIGYCSMTYIWDCGNHLYSSVHLYDEFYVGGRAKSAICRATN